MPTNIPYHFHIDGGSCLFGPLYKDVHRFLIRQTTTLCKMTSKKDIFNFFSQSYQREAYKYTLSLSYPYIKYSAF